MIEERLLDRTAQVFKAVASGGSYRLEETPAFTWPCRVEPVKPAAQAQTTGHFVYDSWMLYGNVPDAGQIDKGDRLVLDGGTDLRVTDVARQTGPGGKAYLELITSRSGR